MASPESELLLELNQKLLTAIITGDWATYAQLCDKDISCFEPEARGQLVIGQSFHKYYFPAAPVPEIKKQVTMCSPRVEIVGDLAFLAYVRLTQYCDAGGASQTGAAEETRIWQKKDGVWKHTHFHRSPLA